MLIIIEIDSGVSLHKIINEILCNEGFIILV